MGPPSRRISTRPRAASASRPVAQVDGPHDLDAALAERARRVGRDGAGEEDGGHLVRRGDEPRVERQVAAAADDDAYRVGTLGVAHREEWVVAARRTGPDHDGVGRGAHGVHQAAAGRRGDPAGVAAGRGDLAVERDGRLEGDERQAFADEARERFVQLLAERVQRSRRRSRPRCRRRAGRRCRARRRPGWGRRRRPPRGRRRRRRSSRCRGRCGRSGSTARGSRRGWRPAPVRRPARGRRPRRAACPVRGGSPRPRARRRPRRPPRRGGWGAPAAGPGGRAAERVRAVRRQSYKNPGAHRLQGSCDYTSAVFFHPDSDRRPRNLT